MKARRAPAPGVVAPEIALRHAAIVKALAEIVYDWHPKADSLIWEGEFTRILGYSAEEMGDDTRSWTSRVHPDDLPRVLAEVESARQKRRLYDVEYRFRHRDGHYLWMHDRAVLFLDRRGELEHMVGVFRDVSARKRAEEELRSSERLRRLIIDTEPECVKVVSPEGRLLQMNPAGLTMLEAGSLEQAQAHGLFNFVRPDHRAAFAALHRRVMAGEDGSLEFEVEGLRGARRWLETRAVPLRDEHGAVTALLGVTRDVTERRAQHAHILRLSRMRGVMSSVNALIVRARSRAELFQEACRIAVEEGGFGLAWVALIQGDAMVPVARHGADDGHLEKARFSLRGDGADACNSAVRAVHERRPVVCADIADDPTVTYWREPLLALGYRSFVAWPLVAGGQVVGCLHLYAREPGFFDDEEMKLLADLSGEISFALEFIIKDEQLDLMSVYDPLTRLPNRNLFLRRLPGFIQAAQDSDRRLALLMLDLERFKAINDTVGHAAGDELLKQVGERLRFHAGGQSFMAHLGGDRFAAVIPGLERGADVEALVAGGAWDRLDPPFQHGGLEFAVSMKVGIAVFPQDGADAEALLRNAELALKQGKAAGRRITRYTSELGKVARRRTQLDRQLRRALERGELHLYYQPKLALRTGLVSGAEALLRWHDPEQGVVLPSSFIPLMEETGLILEVGRFALSHAVAQRAAWLAAGLPAPRIGVNVSAVQLREPGFVESVRAALAAVPGAAAGLELEVTESTTMVDPEASVATLRTLRELGVTIAMDDFGTGYSSLAALTRLPLNVLKIDRSFVDTMVRDPDTMSVVSAIVALAHSLNLKVVAEGVETEEQLQFLRVLRCDEMQGFLFSPALPAADFAALLASGRKL